MNKFKLYFILPILSLVLFSCSKSDSVTIVPLRDYAVQYATDKDSIEIYLKNNYLESVSASNSDDGYADINIQKIPTGGTQTSIWNNTTFPLQYVTVKNDNRKTYLVNGQSDDGVSYKLYYLVINQGGGSNPTVVDSTYTTYKGWTLNNKSFDSSTTPVWSTYPALSQSETSFISGYRQILSKIKTASGFTTGPNGTVFNNSGTVVVFVPSGLGYYNTARSGIPSYSCTVFRIRLHTLRKRDHDKDRVLSMYEDINNDGDFFNDDTDGDNVPDFLDVDDDGDTYLTKYEIKIQKRVNDATTTDPLNTKLVEYGYYPFNGATVDDPTTANVDESQGIPKKYSGSQATITIKTGDTRVFNTPQQSDFTDPLRLRRHLDKTAVPLFE